MDVLVTGATGVVGANVARLLVAHGHRVRVLARPASSLRALEHTAEARGYLLAVDLDGSCESAKDRGRTVFGTPSAAPSTLAPTADSTS